MALFSTAATRALVDETVVVDGGGGDEGGLCGGEASALCRWSVSIIVPPSLYAPVRLAQVLPASVNIP